MHAHNLCSRDEFNALISYTRTSVKRTTHLYREKRQQFDIQENYLATRVNQCSPM